MSDPNKFTEEELNSQDNEIFQNLPKDESGKYDESQMTPEQKAVYWKGRFSQSSKGFGDYKQKTDRELELLRKNGIKIEDQKPSNADEDLDFGIPKSDPSFKVLERVVNIAKQQAIKEIAGDPLFVNSIAGSNSSRLEQAFTALSKESGYEHLLNYKDDIVQKYFSDPLSIPENVLEVLRSVAGGVLWEHRNELEDLEKPKHDRVDMLSGHAGNKKSNNSGRSMEYWQRMAEENPVEFSKPDNQKLFNEDMKKL